VGKKTVIANRRLGEAIPVRAEAVKAALDKDAKKGWNQGLVIRAKTWDPEGMVHVNVVRTLSRKAGVNIRYYEDERFPCNWADPGSVVDARLVNPEFEELGETVPERSAPF